MCRWWSEIKSRLIVRLGATPNKMIRFPTIDVGIRGKAKERVVSEKIAMLLIQNVYAILGIEPPPAK